MKHNIDSKLYNDTIKVFEEAGIIISDDNVLPSGEIKLHFTEAKALVISPFGDDAVTLTFSVKRYFYTCVRVYDSKEIVLNDSETLFKTLHVTNYDANPFKPIALIPLGYQILADEYRYD